MCAAVFTLHTVFLFLGIWPLCASVSHIYSGFLVFLSAVSPSFYCYFKHSIQYIQWHFYTVSRPYTKAVFDNAYAFPATDSHTPIEHIDGR